MIKYKISIWQEDREVFYIDKIPLHIYLNYLDEKRLFDKESAIQYTYDIYEIDISGLIDEYYFWFKENVYMAFEKSNPMKKADDGSREYFQGYGRKYFVNFRKKYSEHVGYDEIQPVVKYSIVHHIHPLVFSKNNGIRNLIQLSDFSHDLLHMNPLEDDRNMCFKALDYLGYLYSSEKQDEIIKENGIINYLNNPQLGLQMIKVCMIEEMKKYYKVISNRTKSNANMAIAGGDDK